MILTHDNNNLLNKNQHIYDNLWGGAWLLEAQHYNTWPLVESLLESHPTRIEVAPGMRPRLPAKDTTFVDISHAALCSLNEVGGHSSKASICNLPFADDSFDLVCALDIIEHVEDDTAALSELTRIAKDGATLLLSTPLHPDYWTPFDDFVGHYRRYEPARLLSLLEQNGLNVSKSAAFGMKPRSSRLVDLGMWFLQHQPKRAMWWYNRVFPFIARRQKELTLSDGLLPLDDLAEIFMVCTLRK